MSLQLYLLYCYLIMQSLFSACNNRTFTFKIGLNFAIILVVKDIITPYNCLFLLTPYIVVDYYFEQVILSFLILHVLVQQFINRYIFNRFIKETNWLINKGMCVLLFEVFKHLLLRKTDALKTCGKSKFVRKKI